MLSDPARPAVPQPTTLVVLSTAPDKETAAALASKLVEARVAACVNVVPGISSVYRWQGEVHHDDEVLLVAKTDAAHVEALIAEIVRHHPYDNPEAIALEVVGGAVRYLRWVGEVLE